ncbi:hypothetical protein Hdeb2414_s0004g00130781 [Helianthus debilis subsp. tardiflorus]
MQGDRICATMLLGLGYVSLSQKAGSVMLGSIAPTTKPIVGRGVRTGRVRGFYLN